MHYKVCRLLLGLSAVMVAGCVVAFVVMTAPLSVYAALGYGGYRAFKKGIRYLCAHGTARWADIGTLRKAGLGDRGVILGRMAEARPPLLGALLGLFNPKESSAEVVKRFCHLMMGRYWQALKDQPIIRVNPVNLAVFAPVGAGKGVSFAIPWLLTCTDSAVVLDFKAELALATAEARRQMGHKVVFLNPCKIAGLPTDTFCPLDFIDPDSPESVDEFRDLGEAFVVRTGKEQENHWNDAAAIRIAAMIAAVVNFGADDDRNIQTVRSLLTDTAKMEGATRMLIESRKFDGIISRMGQVLTHFKDRELASTLTTSGRFTAFLDTPMVADNTRTSSFDPAALVSGKMTVYLILPPHHVRSQIGLLRMWVSSLMRAVVRGGIQERNKVQFILDESATLGRMEILEDALDKYRAFGVRLQFYYQSMGQLKKCWAEDQGQTLLSNTTQVFFGVNDYETAQYVSNRCGDETIVVTSGGTGTGTSRQTQESRMAESFSYSKNGSSNWSQLGRKLLKPEEVLALPRNGAVTFHPGVPPIYTTLIKYFEEPWLKKKQQWPGVKMALKAAAVSVLTLALTMFLGMVVTGHIRLVTVKHQR